MTVQLTNQSSTLEALEALVEFSVEVSIYRMNPDTGRALAIQRARLTSASGPFPPYGWSVSYLASNGDRSFLALPPDWTWRITTTGEERI